MVQAGKLTADNTRNPVRQHIYGGYVKSEGPHLGYTTGCTYTIRHGQDATQQSHNAI